MSWLGDSLLCPLIHFLIILIPQRAVIGVVFTAEAANVKREFRAAPHSTEVQCISQTTLQQLTGYKN